MGQRWGSSVVMGQQWGGSGAAVWLWVPLWIFTPHACVPLHAFSVPAHPWVPPMDSHPPPMGAPPPSAIRGSSVPSLLPADPTQPSALRQLSSTRHVLLTAETHNFPTGN